MQKYLLFTVIALFLCALIGFVIWFLVKKREGICPICLIKQHLKKSKITMKIPKEYYQGGDAPTPPMGWSSWNTFRNNIDEGLILETANALRDSGLAEAGYCYVNLDDCWHSSLRDEAGRLQGDLSRFPSGIPALVDKINALGLKAGIYSSNGEYTCEDLPGSLGYEKIDAKTFAGWGVEYCKYDFCHNKKIPSLAPLVVGMELRYKDSVVNFEPKCAELSGLARIQKDKGGIQYISFLGQGKGSARFPFSPDFEGEAVLTLIVKKRGNYEKYLVVQIGSAYYEMMIPATDAWSPLGRYQIRVRIPAESDTIRLFNPVCTRADSSYIQYKRMGQALLEAATEKKITYSVCEHGKHHPKDWAWNTGNLWRTTPDILPNWMWITMIYNRNLKLAELSGPGHWNDPDMLEVGNGKLTLEENKTHFALWCMMCAPLILGNDIRKFLKGNEDSDILNLLKNKRLIALDQDALGQSCIRYKKTLSTDFLVKQKADGGIALCVFNKLKRRRKVVLNLAEVPDAYPVKDQKFIDVWTDKIYDKTLLSFVLPPHGCVVLDSVF